MSVYVIGPGGRVLSIDGEPMVPELFGWQLNVTEPQVVAHLTEPGYGATGTRPADRPSSSTAPRWTT